MRSHIRGGRLALCVGGFLALGATLVSCGDGDQASSPAPTAGTLPPAVAQAEAAQTPTDPRIITADNQLGMSLLNQLLAGSTGNVSLSPPSIALVLQIIYNGAKGAAQTSMAQTLQLGSMTTGEVNSANAALQASLDTLNSQVSLNLANSLWTHGDGSTFVPDFVQINQTYYGATLGDLDGPAGTTQGDPNAWISAQTHGLIPAIIPADLIPRTQYLVVNAIYFKGAWTTPFDPGATVAAPFTRADGSQVTVPMMNLNASEPYYKGAGFQALSLPYAQGRASMLLLLPDPGVSLTTLLAGLTAADIDSIVAQQHPGPGTLALPRFTTAYTASLNEALTDLGMGPALNGGDFTGVWAGGTLTDVFHAARIEVDEQGTTAAGGTGGGQITSILFGMSIDRPFFYAIRDSQTGALLFIGAMQDPAQG